MKQLSSNLGLQLHARFEENSHIAEKSSKNRQPGMPPQNAIEENCLCREISSKKNKQKV